MKSFALLTSVLALNLNPKNPFEGLEQYKNFITVDPRIASGTGRPDCNRGKCQFEPWDRNNNKALLAVRYNNTIDEAHCADDSDPKKVYTFLTYLQSTTDLELGRVGYDGINIIIEEGNIKDFDEVADDLTEDDKVSLTLHYNDYLKLRGVFNDKRLLEKIQHVYVEPSSEIPSYASLSKSEKKFIWLARDEEHAYSFPSDYPEEQILIAETVSFVTDPFSNEQYCDE
ncbi:hypothetical protein DSO57_1024651 [Entomophthora muscae]|uniref:Uncharacterized protein n=1 Tax=Entomophthora muscae TaxID=34485 RepID=A0ACC2TDF8_9FUNG|nr:hypothetical protein DSO57_1024651 [Entomophthora muscae]